MARQKKKNKVRRYLKVTKRKVKRLKPKKVWSWFRNNFKEHPFILAILLITWINAALIERIFTRKNIPKILIFHIVLFIAWLVLVTISNLLRDKQKVKWYLKKRFVFSTLVLPFSTPLGFILLWSGSKFKKVTKIILTIIFGAIFIFYSFQSNKRYDKLLTKSSFERVVESITQTKRKIYLNPVGQDALIGLKLANLPQKTNVKLAISEIATRCSPAVVSIKTKDKEGRLIGMGSGFIISKNGIIVTNFHVVESAYQVEVKIGEEIFTEVYLIKGIPNLDMALLKINSENLPFLSIGDSDSLVGGQFVIVLSNPVGFERSISNGIVSAIRSKGEIELIQMTAPVSPGSSGGPVINEYGEVVGITTSASFLIAQNLNFAIPIKYLNKIIKEAQLKQ